MQNQAKNLLLLLAVALATCVPAASDPASDTTSPADHFAGGPVSSGCTVFTLSGGGRTFFGGNDDYINPDSYYWVDPGDDRNYGAIWIGQPDNVQQGVNEQGLAYDANGLPRVDVHPHAERIPVPGSYNSYPIHILHECATIEEVIAWVQTHRWHSFMHDQMHFADAAGDAVIISAGKDGEVVFTRKPPGDGFLVSTNFNVANPANSNSYPCWRYDRAEELLGRLLNRGEQLTAEDAAGVLRAVHVEAGSGWTISSMVADLPGGLVYLYYFYQFDQPVVLNVKEELAGSRPPGPLSSLFPDDVQEEAARRYGQIQVKAERCQRVSMIWLAMVSISLILLIPRSFAEGPGARFWVPAGFILGPLVLPVRPSKMTGRKPVFWRDALIEAVGDVMPTVTAFVAVMILIILSHKAQSSGRVQILLIFGLPLVIGWLVFHGPLLTSKTDKKYGRFLIDRMPQVLVAANLGLAGISALAAPLMMYSISTCSVFPFNAWTVVTLWAVTIPGALAGILLLFLYEFWAVRGGFRAWSVPASRETKVRTPSWRDLWWWILLSYVALAGGLAVSVALTGLLTS